MWVENLSCCHQRWRWLGSYTGIYQAQYLSHALNYLIFLTTLQDIPVLFLTDMQRLYILMGLDIIFQPMHIMPNEHIRVTDISNFSDTDHFFVFGFIQKPLLATLKYLLTVVSHS